MRVFIYLVYAMLGKGAKEWGGFMQRSYTLKARFRAIFGENLPHPRTKLQRSWEGVFSGGQLSVD